MMRIFRVCLILCITIVVQCFSQSIEQAIEFPNLAIEEIQVPEQGEILVLNDGSQWNIKYFGGAWRLFGWGWKEQEEISHWEKGDLVQIQYPGSGNFFDFFLEIHNTSRGEEVLAELRKPPAVEYAACLQVSFFEPVTQEVTLNDGTVWEKSSVDMSGAFFFQDSPVAHEKWKVGDPVTFIRGEDWINGLSLFLWNHSTGEVSLVFKPAP